MENAKRACRSRRDWLRTFGAASVGLLLPFGAAQAQVAESLESRPNVILIMTDDQGWGQTGYYNHPLLKTPHLDAMAANGLRFDRFYAASPVCSPTRASVLTGRSNDRSGVSNHGYPLRLQEKTLPQALKDAGYATGHFGKWHLNGVIGPGVPVLESDPYGPEAFGFDTWLTTTNFFDIDPVLGTQNGVESFDGDSSDIIAREALAFITDAHEEGQPFFAVIWDGSPHSPWLASEADAAPFGHLGDKSAHHHGELVAFDRSLGKIRQRLRDLGVAENTILWFCSDNGGLSQISPDTVGGLRGHKADLWEGGIRVPGIIEWPGHIAPGITDFPASTMDIFPTVVDLLNLPEESMLEPVDGASLTALFRDPSMKRDEPIPFRFRDAGAWIDNNYKLITTDRQEGVYELYDLKADPQESQDISADEPVIFERMRQAFESWSASVDSSVAGLDYPEQSISPKPPKGIHWKRLERYQAHLENWKDRPEYAVPLRNLGN